MWKTQLKIAERRNMFILITVSQVMRCLQMGIYCMILVVSLSVL